MIMRSHSPAAFIFPLLVKIGSKFIAVYPVAKLCCTPNKEAIFATLLMSTGLTVGTISALSALFGLSHGMSANAFYLPRHLLVGGAAAVPAPAQAAAKPDLAGEAG